jgi:hypothetical protein
MSESLRESRILRRLALKPYRFVKLYAKRLRHRGRNRYCSVCDSHVQLSCLLVSTCATMPYGPYANL